jgi:membrane peptidoglycan carboxypeptidase
MNGIVGVPAVSSILVGGKRKAAPSARTTKTKARTEEKSLRVWLRRTFKWGSISALAMVLIVAAIGAWFYRSVEVPDPNEDFLTESTVVYYSNGKAELGSFAVHQRDSIPLEEMPDVIKDAVVAAENQSFWTDRGIDPKGIARAAYNNFRGNSTQGASTITQQYVKILYLTQDQTIKRKLDEAVLSTKIQRELTKEQVLEGYLNTIYFGRGAYGIQAAARAYFAKDAADLNLRQAAVLASVLNNPSRFDPANGDSASAIGLKIDPLWAPSTAQLSWDWM